MIEILLATHNGEKYLSQQIDSLLKQTYRDFHITIFDDGSNDNTNKIIEKYIYDFPFRISRLASKKNFRNACKSFNYLINNTDSEYVALCDQDDIWKKDKLYFEMMKMLELEKKNGKDTPLLVHCDLSITDEKSQIIHKSFIKYKKISKKTKLPNLITENNVTGCTCLFNKSLLLIAKNIPKKIKMHDWWIALCAACFGETEFVNKKLVLYRQHENNVLGAFNKVKNNKMINNSISYSYYQAKKLLLTFSEELPVNQFRIIAIYSCFPLKNKLFRIKNILFNGYKKKSVIKTIGQIWYC